MSDDHCELTSYAEIVEVITNLRFLVRERRRRERISMRALAMRTGLSASTIHRFETVGYDVSTDGLVALIRWVGDLDATLEGGAPSTPAGDTPDGGR